jgi:hypothetical protein
MLDLLIKSGSLPNGRAGIDIAVQGEHITEVGLNVTAQSVKTIEAGASSSARLSSMLTSTWTRRFHTVCCA